MTAKACLEKEQAATYLRCACNPWPKLEALVKALSLRKNAADPGPVRAMHVRMHQGSKGHAGAPNIAHQVRRLKRRVPHARHSLAYFARWHPHLAATHSA